MAHTSRDVEVDGLRIHYLEAGTGPAVLLLHGWPTSAFLWRNTLHPLAETHRVIALDLPGFGGSDKPDASYSFRFHERVLEGFLGFYWGKMDAWYEDGARMLRPETPTAGDANPFVDWLVKKAPHARTPEALIQGFAAMLVDAGLPLWRLRVMIRTLHPQLLASVYTSGRQ